MDIVIIIVSLFLINKRLCKISLGSSGLYYYVLCILIPSTGGGGICNSEVGGGDKHWF